MSFANIRITTRLALGFGLVLALIVAIVALAALTQREVGALSDQLTNVDYPKTRLVNRMLAANLENAKSVMELMVATEPAEVTAIQAAIEANRKSNATTMEELDKLLVRPEAKTLYEALKQARARYIASRNKVMDLVVKDKNREQAVALWTSDARPKLDAYSKSIRSLLDFQETLIHEDNRAIEQTLSRNRQLNLVGGALALLFGVSFAWWIARSITRPLRAAVDLAEAVAAGDLTRRIETGGRDEVGHLLAALGRMNDRLAGVIGQIREATDAVGTASREIAAGNADLSQRTEEQAIEPGRDGVEHGRAHLHGEAERRQRAAGQPAGDQRVGGGQQGRRGGRCRSSATMDEINGLVEEDRRHHQRDRRHRVPDQHPGAQRRGRSGARRRAGPRLRGRGRRGAQPGPAQRGGGQGDQGR